MKFNTVKDFLQWFIIVFSILLILYLLVYLWFKFKETDIFQNLFLIVVVLLLTFIVNTSFSFIYNQCMKGFKLDVFYSIIEQINSYEDQDFPFSVYKNIKQAYQKNKFN